MANFRFDIFRTLTLFKWVFAGLQIIAGDLILLLNQNSISKFIISITQEEILEDSKDWLANYLIKFSSNLSISTLHFIAFYTIIHGVVKFFLLLGIWKRKLFVYPISILVFSLFLIYQIYRYTFTHSFWLIVLSIIDVVYIYLLLKEYSKLKK